MRHRTFFVVAHPRLEDANRRKTPKQSPSHATSSHVKYEIKTNKPFHRPLSQTARPEHQSSSRTVSDRTRCDGRPRRRSPGGRRQPRHARETVLLLNVQNGPAPNTFSERSQRPPFSVSGRLERCGGREIRCCHRIEIANESTARDVPARVIRCSGPRSVS